MFPEMWTANRSLCSLATALSFGLSAVALTAAEWRGQSIYQVVTDRFARGDLSTTATCDTSAQVYCGGTWRGLISKLDYIQNMGFTAVWISPVVKQMDGQTQDGSSYHGYWAQDIWALNPAFGGPSDLSALSAALHARGMYLMVDVVTNHMAYQGCRSCVDYSVFNPFSSSSYYHPACAIDYSNQSSIEMCWQGSDVVSDDVRRIWNNWVAAMVSAYSIDGMRIDSVKHVEPSFWAGFRETAGVYLMGEVYSGDPGYVAPYQKYTDGVLDYPSYYWILRAFQSPSGSIGDLVQGLNTLKDTAVDGSLYGSFLENHDVERFPYFTGDMALAKNAIAFTMLKDGIPIIYQGQEQHYAGGGTPRNREALWLSGYVTTSDLYKWIAKLNRIRAKAANEDAGFLTYQSTPIYSDDHTIAMRKGNPGSQLVGVFTNIGSNSTLTVTLSSAGTGFGPGQSLVDVLSCTALSTDSSGNLSMTISGGIPRALYPMSLGSGICPLLTGTPASTSTSASLSTSSTTTSTNPAPCTATVVPVNFGVLVTTVFGDTIKIAGNTSALGSWNPSSAVALSASKYTSGQPLWDVVIPLQPGSIIEYKFIKVSSSGLVAWEANPNRRYTATCAAATLTSTWQS